MSSDYPDAIYSNFGRIKNRVAQINDTMQPQISAYQRYIDSKINNTLRSVLGTYDANGFFLVLPLNGTYDVISIQDMIVQLHMDSEIWMAADDCVIAKFRQDTAENDDKVRIAEESLIRIVQTKYGSAISIDQDFTTDYLAAQKVRSFNNGVIQLFDGSGVLLAFNTPIPNANTETGNPDSRVIFVPAPPSGI